MKSAKLVGVILLFGEASVNNVGARLVSKCTNDNFLEINIPYPDKRTAKILHLSSGVCNENNFILNGGTFKYNESSSHAEVRIPIDRCELNTEPKCENR